MSDLNFMAINDAIGRTIGNIYQTDGLLSHIAHIALTISLTD